MSRHDLVYLHLPLWLSAVVEHVGVECSGEPKIMIERGYEVCILEMSVIEGYGSSVSDRTWPSIQ